MRYKSEENAVGQTSSNHETRHQSFFPIFFFSRRKQQQLGKWVETRKKRKENVSKRKEKYRVPGRHCFYISRDPRPYTTKKPSSVDTERPARKSVRDPDLLDDTDPRPASEFTLSTRHRILRRGRSYGRHRPNIVLGRTTPLDLQLGGLLRGVIVFRCIVDHLSTSLDVAEYIQKWSIYTEERRERERGERLWSERSPAES